MRRSELVALVLSDYCEYESSLHVRNGKGNKARIVYVSAGAQQALEGWLVVRGQTPGSFFCRINKYARIEPHGMTGQSVRKMLSKRGKQAGLAPFSPHDLRRTMIGDLLDAGADISTVQRVAGHANVTTTARYDRRGESVKRQAACLLSVPYIKQKGGKCRRLAAVGDADSVALCACAPSICRICGRVHGTICWYAHIPGLLASEHEIVGTTDNL